ncbi:hypothetical protein MOP88_12115 [Sphingomonas sp. WKB10]|nr:hypothetical protein [Sphingomonas sp. WKB10]
MRDYPQLEATLRRLVAVDPGQRDAHVRQLILTLLRHDDAAASPAARQADFDALMAQLSDTGDGDARAFKATVYAQAELDPQALDQLRQALAARPVIPTLCRASRPNWRASAAAARRSGCCNMPRSGRGRCPSSCRRSTD